MRSLLPTTGIVALLLLSACDASVKVGDGADGDNVHIAMNGDKDKHGVTLDVPGLSAKLSLPDFNLGQNMDMDGIKLAPDTKVKIIDVVGHDKDQAEGEGRVHLEFTNPGTPATLIDYYKRAATGAGYDGVTATATGVAATKGAKQFALSVAADGAGSRGAITMRGSE
jgi:hypothetical protein